MANEQGIHFQVQYDEDGIAWQRWDCFLCRMWGKWVRQEQVAAEVAGHLDSIMHKDLTTLYNVQTPVFEDREL